MKSVVKKTLASFYFSSCPFYLRGKKKHFEFPHLSHSYLFRVSYFVFRASSSACRGVVPIYRDEAGSSVFCILSSEFCLLNSDFNTSTFDIPCSIFTILFCLLPSLLFTFLLFYSLRPKACRLRRNLPTPNYELRTSPSQKAIPVLFSLGTLPLKYVQKCLRNAQKCPKDV